MLSPFAIKDAKIVPDKGTIAEIIFGDGSNRCKSMGLFHNGGSVIESFQELNEIGFGDGIIIYEITDFFKILENAGVTAKAMILLAPSNSTDPERFLTVSEALKCGIFLNGRPGIVNGLPSMAPLERSIVIYHESLGVLSTLLMIAFIVKSG